MLRGGSNDTSANAQREKSHRTASHSSRSAALCRHHYPRMGITVAQTALNVEKSGWLEAICRTCEAERPEDIEFLKP
jgi:hypothetical protein